MQVFFKILIVVNLVICSITNSFASSSDNKDYFIYPINNCKKFHFKYKYHSKAYWLTYPIDIQMDQVKYLDEPIKLDDISDLSMLVDVVNTIGADFCEPPYGKSGTFADCEVNLNLSPEYIDLTRDVLKLLGRTGNYCSQIAPVLELQDKLEGLENAEDFLHLEDDWKFIKIFASDEEDRLIDHFESCGGEKFSSKFIRNMILMTAREACIMPSPPGLLSWDEAKQVADDISSGYNNMSIRTLSKKMDTISRKSYKEFTRVATVKNVKGLLGSEVDAEELVNGLDSFKNIDKIKTSKLEKYLTDIYQLDTTIELAEKAFPALLWSKAKDKLPDGFTKEKFDRYIVPHAEKEFQQCLEKPKERIRYNSTLSLRERSKFIRLTKEFYCKKFNTCETNVKNRCEKPQINLLSDDPLYDDTQVIMGCAYSGFISGIEIMLPVIVKDKIPEIEPRELAAITKTGWDKLSHCFNNDDNMYKRYGEMGALNYPIRSSGRSYDTLRGLTQEEFETSLLKCVSNAETEITETLVTQMIKSNATVQDYFPDTTKDQNGKTARDEVVGDTLTKAFRPCMEHQNELVQKSVISAVDPNFCQPAIEIFIGTKVISKKLDEMYREYEVQDNPRAVGSIEKFQDCTKDAGDLVFEDIGSQTSQYAITDVEDAKSYMENNPAFISCVQSAISDAAAFIGGQEFESLLMGQRERLATFSNILNKRPEVEKISRECFEKGLKEVGSYSNFLAWNDRDGSVELKAQCEMEVKKYIIPKILISETQAKLGDISKMGLLDTSPSNIIAQVSQVMLNVRKFPTEAPKGNKSAWALGEAYEKYTSENPDAELDDFITKFEDIVTRNVIGRVYNKFFDKLDEIGTKEYGESYPELKEAMGPACIQEIQESLLSSSPPKRKSQGQTTDVDISKIHVEIVKGLHYLKSINNTAYQEQVSKFKAICKDPSRYKTLDSIMDSGVLDFIVRSKVHEAVVAKFNKLALDTYQKEVSKYKSSPFYGYQKPFIDKKYGDLLRLIKDKLEDPEEFNKIFFKDGSRKIESFALDNLSSLLSGDESVAFNKLNLMVTEKLFSDQRLGSFSSEFTKIQLVNNLGILGFEKARDAVITKAKDQGWYVDDSVLDYALPELKKQWTPNNIEKMIAWNTIEESYRKRLQSSLIDNVILPSAKGASESAITSGTDIVAEELTAFTQDYKYRVAYKSSNTGLKVYRKVSFQDRISRRIEFHVRENVGLLDGIAEGLSELF